MTLLLAMLTEILREQESLNGRLFAMEKEIMTWKEMQKENIFYQMGNFMWNIFNSQPPKLMLCSATFKMCLVLVCFNYLIVKHTHTLNDRNVDRLAVLRWLV